MSTRRTKLKKSVDVKPFSDSVWIVEREGVSRARAGRHATEAERAARRDVRDAGGGEVIVRGRDGRVRESDTTVPDGRLGDSAGPGDTAR